MKNTNPVKKLSICETASGRTVVYDDKDCRTWGVPTRPIDVRKFGKDCAAICSGTDHVSYLEYLGVHDLTDFGKWDERLQGAFTIAFFHPDRSRPEGPVLSSFENILLFAMEDRIFSVPEIAHSFQTETVRICEKLISAANKDAENGDKSGSDIQMMAARIIQILRLRGVAGIDVDNAIWQQDNVWEILVRLCRHIYPNCPIEAFWICDTAFACDGVYVPVPEDIIESLRSDPNTLFLLSRHQDRRALSIRATPAGELYVTDWESHWWVFPNAETVDRERLNEDCRTICKGILQTSYVKYIGVRNLDQMKVGDDEYVPFLGEYRIATFNTDTSNIEMKPMFAGPENLRRFGVEELIDELPEAIAHFHTETTRICRKLVHEATEHRSGGNLDDCELQSSAVNAIRHLKMEAISTFEAGQDIWLADNVWEILTLICRDKYPDREIDALLLCKIAYDIDGVYVPVPEDIVEFLQSDPETLLMLSRHQARAPKQGGANEQESGDQEAQNE